MVLLIVACFLKLGCGKHRKGSCDAVHINILGLVGTHGLCCVIFFFKDISLKRLKKKCCSRLIGPRITDCRLDSVLGTNFGQVEYVSSRCFGGRSFGHFGNKL